MHQVIDLQYGLVFERLTFAAGFPARGAPRLSWEEKSWRRERNWDRTFSA